MLGGKISIEQSGHQPTPEEQEIINRQMPEGSAKKEASDLRQGWLESINTSNSEAIKDIGALKEQILHGVTIFSGNIQGHEIYITSEFNGHIDKKQLRKEDLEKLYKEIVQVRSGINYDKENIRAIQREEEKDEAALAVDEMLGGKKE